MANTVFKLRRSSVAGKVPNTSTLAIGELGLNLTDRKLYSSDGTNVWETGANLSSVSVGNSSSVFFAVNATGVYTNNDVLITKNDKSLKFATVNTSAYSYFTQQSDDNFVFYTTNASYGARPVWSIYANNSSSPISFSVAVQLNNWINLNSQAVYANGSSGTAGQVLTSNGSATYWSTSSGGGGSVNTAAQYAWTNTHTFSANVSFNSPVGLATNTAIYFNGTGDANWRIARNSNTLTKWIYTNNTIDIVTANSTNEGFAIGLVANATYFETGYLGTYIANKIVVGSASSNATINSTIFTGTANNSSYLGGTIASGYQTTAGLSANVATLTANNTSFVGAVSAANVVSNAQLSANLGNYQTSAGLSANVATLTANNANNLGGQLPAYYTNASNITTGTLPYAQLGAAVVNTSGNFTLAGNTTFSGTFVNAVSYNTGSIGAGTGGSVQNTTVFFVGNNTVNATVNTTTLYIGGNIIANSTGANNAFNLGGTAAASYQLNSTLNANIASYLPTYTGTVNAAIYQTGAPLTGTGGLYANVTTLIVGNNTINTALTSAEVRIGGTLIGNSTGPYGKTEGSLNVNSATQATNATNLNSQPGSYYTNATNITTGTLPYAQLGSAVVNTSGSFTLAGNTTFSANVFVTGAVVNAVLYQTGAPLTGTGGLYANVTTLVVGNNTINTTITSAGLVINGTAVVANSSGIFTTGTVNSALHTTGSTGTGTGGLIANVTTLFIGNNTVNSYLNTTGLNINAVTIANTTGVYTGVVNGSTLSVGTVVVANSITLNANGFVVNSTGGYFTGLVNSTSFNAGSIGTGTGGSVQNTTTVFIGNNTINTVISSAGLTVNGTATIANSSGVYTTGTVNAASHTTGSTGTGTGGLIANVTTLFIGNNTVNSYFNTTGLNVNAVTIANTTGVYTGVVNGSSITVGSSFSVNSTIINVNSLGVYSNGSLGTNGQVLTSNGTKTYWSSIVTNNPVRQAFTGDGACTVFTVAGGYTPNNLDVYLNGIKLASSEITVTSGTTFTLSSAPPVSSIVEAVGFTNALTSSLNTALRQTFTGDGACTTFTVAGGYTPNYIDVYGNGVKYTATEVTTSSGSTIVFGAAPPNGAVIDVVGYQMTAFVINTNSQYTWGNVQTFNANITLGSTAGFKANGTVGTTGQVLTSNGSSAYWATATTDPTPTVFLLMGA